MSSKMVNWLRAKEIDSYQKLRVLLFLYKNHDSEVTIRDLGQHLHIGDTLLLEKIIADLRKTRLVGFSKNYLILQQTEEVTTFLAALTEAFNDPLTRQKLLKQVRSQAALSRYVQTRRKRTPSRLRSVPPMLPDIAEQGSETPV